VWTLLQQSPDKHSWCAMLLMLTLVSQSWGNFEKPLWRSQCCLTRRGMCKQRECIQTYTMPVEFLTVCPAGYQPQCFIQMLLAFALLAQPLTLLPAPLRVLQLPACAGF
jgi:hypothetical protein